MSQIQTNTILTRGMTLLLATAVGVIVANLYYAQPIIAMIAKSIGLAPEAAGLVVTLTQVGYGLGVLLIVPLSDIVENRKLVLFMMVVAIFGILGLAFASHMVPYFIAAFATGVGASTVQIIVPFAAHFAPEEKRGQVVGTIMSGLMLGIMFSRPAASLLTDFFSWHAVFVLSAALMVALSFVLYFMLPPRQVEHRLKYTQLLKSMGTLFATSSVLRRRSIYQGFMFGSFCLFWTASPLYLASPEFHLSQTAIAIFALVGVSGAVAAPFAGKAADKGLSQKATVVAMLMAASSYLLSHFFPAGSTIALAALVLAAVLLDAGVIANLVLGQRSIFQLPAEFRGRLNGIYVACIFIGGAIGSSLGAWAYAKGGWNLASWVGLAMPLIALAYFATEKASNGESPAAVHG